VTTTEFDDVASSTAEHLVGRPIDDRIAAACRGSGNPAALAWLAEECGLAPGARVVDLGGGLAGPTAWLARHYGCSAVVLDPSPGATRSARRLFDLPFVRADAAHSPLRRDTFDVALVLGVVSVVDDPVSVLTEAARLARAVAVIEYCGTRGAPVDAGGSRFPTPDELVELTARAGFEPRATTSITMPAPRRWSELQREVDAGEAGDGDSRRAERAIDELIGDGTLAPYALAARRG
jgi:SAM-dependent methyltransferase